MRKWTLMTTVAAASIAASAVAAQTQDPNDPKKSIQPPAAASDQNAQPQSQKNVRQVNPPAQSDQQTTGQNTPAASTAQQNTTGQNAPASSQSTSGQNAAQPNPQSTSQQNGTPATQQSTQNPTANQPAAAQTPPAAQPNQQTGQSAQPAQAPAQTQTQAPALNNQQQTRFSAIVSQQNVQPVTRVNFAVNVGTTIPGDVRLIPVPNEIVAIVPQYRGYSYFVTTDRIVIVEPSTHRIVYVMPYEGSKRAASTTTQQRNLSLTEAQRQVIRKHAAPARRETSGSRIRREMTVEEEVPSTVELQTFDEPVVRAVPSVGAYRYYRNDDDIVIVDPGERRVLDVIR